MESAEIRSEEMEVQIRFVHAENGAPAFKTGLTLIEAATAVEALRQRRGLTGIVEVNECYAYGFDADGQKYDAIGFGEPCAGKEPEDVAAIPY
jgi:hypothetical protein